MVTFYQVGDSGEMEKVDFSDLSNFALKDECHLDGLSKDTLNFDELLDKGIYTYSDFDGTEKEDGNYPSALTSGYIVVMVEDDSRAQRGITQMVLDDNNGSYYRRGILSETENVFEDWRSLNANNNSITNLSLGKGSPSAIDGIWTEVSNLSYNIQLWKQINGISTMSTTSETNVILNGIETLALTGAQTIYVRDSAGAFSKLCLDISNGGTGATTAAGALSALGAASQTDLNSLRDSVNYWTRGIGLFQQEIDVAKLVTNGIYAVYGNSNLGLPIKGWGVLVVFRADNYCTQIYMNNYVNASLRGMIYYRATSQANLQTSWTQWQYITPHTLE